MFRGDSAHTGRSQFDTSANNGVQKWSFVYSAGVPFAPLSSPTIGADGTIYSTPGDNNLYAFNPDGTLKWTFAAAWPLYPSPTIGADGTIYAPSAGDIRDGYLYAVNPDGTLKWIFHTGFELESSPAIAPIRSGRANLVLPDRPFLSDRIASITASPSDPGGRAVGSPADFSALLTAAAVPA